jgi:general secretion pathway protein H
MALSVTGNSFDLTGAEGFTLVELLVVLAIAGLLLSFVIQQSPGTRSRLEIEEAARTIISDLSRARAVAITRNAVNQIDFNTREKIYTSSLEGLSRTLPPSLQLTLEQPSAPGNARSEARIAFFPDGTATASRLTLSSKGAARTIELNWLTGQALVHD